MFELFTHAITVVNLAREGNLDRLQKLIRAGCRMDRRETYDPWLTPLDAAVMAGNATCADVLLGGGAPADGSSIVEAIKIDSLPILEVFFKHDPSFFVHFTKDRAKKDRLDNNNPRLNPWLLHFTALDYALSMGSLACSQFLTEIGAPMASHFHTCPFGHHAPLIAHAEFHPLGGVDVAGVTEVTKGYYCAWCDADLASNLSELQRENKTREFIRRARSRWENLGDARALALAEYHEEELSEKNRNRRKADFLLKGLSPWSGPCTRSRKII